MIHKKGVLSSDAINRYGFRITVSALEDGIQQKMRQGIATCIGHDMLKPIGWTRPIGLYFEPHLCRTVGITSIAESPGEFEQISTMQKNALNERYAKDCKPYINKVKDILKEHLGEDATWVSVPCVCCYDIGILERVYPKLFAKQDKDGLIYISDLLQQFEHVGQGIFKDKNSMFAVLPHQYFRRNLSVHNNLNYFFLNELMKHQGKLDVKLRIALDRNCIGIAETFHGAIELEYWRGPKFSDDVSKIKKGVTVHGSDDYHRKFNSIIRTEFNWKTEANEQTFESEEIREHASLGVGIDSYGCRYIHSIFDTETKKFKHFDGAIRMYDTEKMLSRMDLDLKSAAKNSDYTKLFRIDGQLPLEDWKSLSSHYYQGNPLIQEYFGTDADVDMGPADTAQVIEEHQETPIRKLIPYAMHEGDGVRLFISYQPMVNPEDILGERYVSGYDLLKGEDGAIKIMESDIIEVKKTLQRMGTDLIIPDNFLICPEDRYLNIPTISHHNLDLENSVSKTIKAIKLLIESLLSKQIEKTIAFTLAWERDGDKQVVISILGHCTDLLHWLNDNDKIPIERLAFKLWLEKQSSWLATNFVKNIDSPSLFEMFRPDGVIFIRRRMVPAEIMPKEITTENGITGYNISFPKSLRELGELYQNREIDIAPVYLLRKSTCTRCGEEYKACPHSKYLDDEVTEKADDFEIAGLFWTEERA